jgi:hypothetical protein
MNDNMAIVTAVFEITPDLPEPFEVELRPMGLPGITAKWRFDNGYGASVINHRGSYGVELAVLRFHEDGGWDLDYDTPVTDDVIGHISGPGELRDLLRSISDLPNHS